MDETQEKSVVESESKEKIGNTIKELDLLHRLLSSYLPLIPPTRLHVGCFDHRQRCTQP